MLKNRLKQKSDNPNDSSQNSRNDDKNLINKNQSQTDKNIKSAGDQKNKKDIRQKVHAQDESDDDSDNLQSEDSYQKMMQQLQEELDLDSDEMQFLLSENNKKPSKQNTGNLNSINNNKLNSKQAFGKNLPQFQNQQQSKNIQKIQQNQSKKVFNFGVQNSSNFQNKFKKDNICKNKIGENSSLNSFSFDSEKQSKLKEQVEQNCESIKKMSSEKQEDTCAICLEDLKIDIQAKINGCCHKFCFECIKKWGQNSENKCPMCKSIFTIIYHKNQKGEEQTLILKNRDQRTHGMTCNECRRQIAGNQDFEICDLCEDSFIHTGACFNKYRRLQGMRDFICSICRVDLESSSSYSAESSSSSSSDSEESSDSDESSQQQNRIRQRAVIPVAQNPIRQLYNETFVVTKHIRNEESIRMITEAVGSLLKKEFDTNNQKGGGVIHFKAQIELKEIQQEVIPVVQRQNLHSYVSPIFNFNQNQNQRGVRGRLDQFINSLTSQINGLNNNQQPVRRMPRGGGQQRPRRGRGRGR